MITITDAQVHTWLALLLWPFFRILALLSTEPFFSSRSVPMRTRIALALALAILIAPVLPPMPPVEPVSPIGILIILQQVMIGMTMGFVMRVMFTAVEMAGHLSGLQMGLGFASFYDPQHGTNSVVVSQFISLMTMLLFLATNGHLLLIETLIKSFMWLPISEHPLKGAGFRLVAEVGGQIFLLGLLMSLPVLGALLITNFCIGVMSRASPQLNVFSVSFPITLVIGTVALYVSLPRFAGHIEEVILRGLRIIEVVTRAIHW